MAHLIRRALALLMVASAAGLHHALVRQPASFRRTPAPLLFARSKNAAVRKRPTGSSTQRQAVAPGGSSVAWYVRTLRARGHELLTAREELELARTIQQMRAAREAATSLGTSLGRPPTEEEAASAAGLSVAEARDVARHGAEAREKLMTRNLRLCLSIAKRYANKGLSYEDLVQEGNIGLWRATALYDPSRRLRFTTYATWWIRQGMTRALATHSRTIRLPAYLHNFLLSLSKARAVLTQRLGRRATDAELAEQLGVDVSRVAAVAQLPSVVSLDVPVGKVVDGGPLLTLAEVLPDGKQADAVVALDLQLLRQELELLLRLALPPTEQRVMRLRYGLDGDGEPASRKAIAAQLEMRTSQVPTCLFMRSSSSCRK